MKKVLLLVVVFALVAQVAVAAGPQAAGPRPGVGNMMRMYFGELRQGLNAMPNAPHMRGRMRLARERLDDLEALAQSDPAALAARMLERHDAMVAKAREIVANKATLPSQIVVDLKAAQARILERAREQAQKATDPAVAQRRLEALQAKQARVLAQVERNAEQIAAQMVKRAEAMLAEAPAIRARIEAGEGLAIIRERLQKRRNSTKGSGSGQ